MKISHPPAGEPGVAMDANRSLSVVIPVFNDQEVLRELWRRLLPVIRSLATEYEVVFVDDASTDNSWQVLKDLYRSHSHIRVIRLSRNAGQDGATTAGLKAARGEVIVIMDSDLQDPPEDIPKLIHAMERDDVSMVIARWKTRRDSLFRRTASRLVFAVTNRITQIQHQPGLGVFRVMRREILDALEEMPERTSTTLSQVYWLAPKYSTIELDRDSRFAGASGYTLRRMIKLAFDRIFSYSIFPIQMAIVMGTVLTLASFAGAAYFVAQRLWFRAVLPGWTSLIVATLFLFGMNFLFLGILGEYLGRVFLETKRRPKFVISTVLEPRKSSEISDT